MNTCPANCPADTWARIVKIADAHPELECDGMSRVIHFLLSQAGVDHEIFAGAVVCPELGRSFDPHLWVQTADGIIDFRAQMWLGDNPLVPHGFFAPENFGCDYDGEAIDISVNAAVFEILTSY